MTGTLANLLHGLSTVPEDEEMHLAGHIVRGSSGRVRVIVAGVYLDIDADDIVDVTNGRLSDRFAIPVNIILRRGAPIYAIGSSDPYRDLIDRGRVPFAFLARPQEKAQRFSIEKRRTTLHRKERKFLQKNGVLSEARTP